MLSKIKIVFVGVSCLRIACLPLKAPWSRINFCPVFLSEKLTSLYVSSKVSLIMIISSSLTIAGFPNQNKYLTTPGISKTLFLFCSSIFTKI
jgi:hypothetical protein